MSLNEAETLKNMKETYTNIMKILKQDKLTPMEHLVVLTYLIDTIFELFKEVGVSDEVIKKGREKIARRILEGDSNE